MTSRSRMAGSVFLFVAAVSVMVAGLFAADHKNFKPDVLYIYRTVRDTKPPGGARFVPELVHNRSGVGSSFDIADLNRDGRPDIVTATGLGTFVFFGKKQDAGEKKP
jgi:hypothetical protein